MGAERDPRTIQSFVGPGGETGGKYVIDFTSLQEALKKMFKVKNWDERCKGSKGAKSKPSKVGFLVAGNVW